MMAAQLKSRFEEMRHSPYFPALAPGDYLFSKFEAASLRAEIFK